MTIASLLNYREIQHDYRNDPRRATAELVEALKDRTVRPDDFDLCLLAEAVVGREWVAQFDPRRGAYRDELFEAPGAVALSNFSNITGQIVFSAILEGYESEEFVFSKVVPSKPSDFPGMEKIPGISDIGDDWEVIDENQPYPLLGVSEDYVEIAEKKKRGGIVPVSKEAMRFDRTGILIEQCRKTGENYGHNKEKRIIDCMVDENAGAVSAALGGHRYHWKGTSYATYQATTPWDNITATNALVDYTDVDAAWQTLAAITNPYTGEPFPVTPTSIIVAPGLAFTAQRVVNATEVRSGDITTGAGTQTITANPIPMVIGKNLKVLSSRLLAARLATDTDWFLGTPEKAFAYFYNWDVTPEEAPSNSEAAFTHDTVLRFKVSERGCAATLQPRFMNKSTVA